MLGQQGPSWLEAKARLDGRPAAGHSWRAWEAKELGLHQPWWGEGSLRVLGWEWLHQSWVRTTVSTRSGRGPGAGEG